MNRTVMRKHWILAAGAVTPYLEAFLERSADLLDNLRGSLERTRHERSALESGRAALEERVAEAHSQVEVRETELSTVRASVDKASGENEAAGKVLAGAETTASEQRQALLRTISGLTNSRNRLGELHREQDRLAYTLGQLEQDRDRLAARRTELDERARQSAGVSTRAVATVDVLERELPRLRAAGIRFVTVSELMALRRLAGEGAS